MTDAILPGSPLRGNIKGGANHFSSSSRFPTGQQQDKPANMTEHILLSSPPSSRTDQQRERAHSLFSLPPCLQQDRPSFTSLITESTQSIMRRAHPIYGPLVSGKSFFHHSSFLLNQRIIGETNWNIFNSCFDFSILIPVLTTASQLLL